ncbi:MAG TPA: putative toxin-antitoxin system toxin component, PIN family [Desulfobacteraceae bacterium]|nr:putative toxin-antitoxin system toxin component, PIN family [Desulfobacteraceae bacterium]
MSRVVIDTNVFVSSFFGGNPRKIIDRWKTGDITLCLSRPVVEEYVEVLKRLGLQDEKNLEALLRLFAQGANSLYAAKTPSLDIVRDDPEDNKFIECAVALHCSVIISGDKHLLSVKDYMGIKILTPKEFLDSR